MIDWLIPMAQKIGFIGTGVMGASMAGHLMKAGHELMIYNRSPEKARELIQSGAYWCPTLASIARQADIVITMVGFPQDVETIYQGDQGLIASAMPGAILVDMTTSCPKLAIQLAETGKSRNIEVVDAPVSGGDIGAREARLSIMAGASESAFKRCLPIFEKLGRIIVHQGPPGSGQHTKMCNQIAIASGMIAVCEALIYARKSGLDPEKVLKSIESGAAGSWSLTNLAPRILNGNYSPGFFVKHFVKDMTIALESAHNMGLDLPGLELALRSYRRLMDTGSADCGTQSLYRLYENGGL